MANLQGIISSVRNRLESQRLVLSRHDARTHLAVLGLLTGVLSGLLITGFRTGIEQVQAWILPAATTENFEALSLAARLLLPVGGALAIGLLFHQVSRGATVVGVVHVMERLAYYQGRLPLKAAILQFLGGIIAIASGHSVGREGPAVHLGAASGSLVAQYLGLPNNTIRTLAACGVAAAISASFNTPLAGVIFALEVIMLEYTLASFLPIMLAAVSADAVCIWFFGNESLIRIDTPNLHSLGELGIVFVLGLLVGLASGLFSTLVHQAARRSQKLDFRLRMVLAGLLVGACATVYPQVMGIGYDTLHLALLGQLGTGMLLGITVFKLVATAGSVGLGVPGGLIGPTLLMGATLGAAVGGVAGQLAPTLVSDVGFYSLLGVAAMMGATLQAPLAALTAVLELTFQPGVIMPGMLVIVVASLTSSELLKQDSVFLTLLRARGMDYRNDPLTQLLRREGVASVMDRSFAQCPLSLEREAASGLLKDNPKWLLVRPTGAEWWLMPAIDLARYLQEHQAGSIELLDIPASRLQLAAVDLHANLQEALQIMRDTGAEALYVQRMNAPGIHRIFGILTRQRIEDAYRL